MIFRLKNIFIISFLPFIFTSCLGRKETVNKDFRFVHAWYVDAFKQKQIGSKRHEGASPLVVGDDIFQGVSDSDIIVVNKNYGFIKRVIKNSGGLDSRPLYHQSMVYFGNNLGEIKAFSYRTGTYEWTYNVGFPIHSSPSIKDGRLFVLASNDTLYAMDAASGKILWMYKRDFPLGRPVIKWDSDPVCFEDIVYTGFSDGMLIGVNIYTGNVVFEKQLMSNTMFKDLDATPYIDEQRIIVPSYDGNLYCLDRSTGTVLWVVKDGGAKSVRVYNDIVYFSSNNGILYSIDINNGAINWSVRIKAGIPSSPIVVSDYVVVASSERGLMFYDKSNGRYAGEFNSGTGAFADPVYNDGYIYYLSNYGVLYALKVL